MRPYTKPWAEDGGGAARITFGPFMPGDLIEELTLQWHSGTTITFVYGMLAEPNGEIEEPGSAGLLLLGGTTSIQNVQLGLWERVGRLRYLRVDITGATGGVAGICHLSVRGK